MHRAARLDPRPNMAGERRTGGHDTLPLQLQHARDARHFQGVGPGGVSVAPSSMASGGLVRQASGGDGAASQQAERRHHVPGSASCGEDWATTAGPLRERLSQLDGVRGQLEQVRAHLGGETSGRPRHFVRRGRQGVTMTHVCPLDCT
jgi:hypothetical protein